MAFLILLASACLATVAVTVGSWARLARTPLRSRWLLVPALAIPITLRFVTLSENQISTIGFGCYIAAYGFLLTFCLLNLNIRGMAIVAIGVACNTLVLGLNHGMPTVAVDGKPVTPSALHNPRAGNDLLPILGDVIVVPGTRETISFGDLIIGVGLINVVFWASRRKRTPALADAPLSVPETDGTEDEPFLDLQQLNEAEPTFVPGTEERTPPLENATATPEDASIRNDAEPEKRRRGRLRKSKGVSLPFEDAGAAPTL
ncbi:MAG: DUF5317 family protein [Acidimicrobiia bacterium]